jgi:hypothetical protein
MMWRFSKRPSWRRVMEAAQRREVDLGLTDDEVAFYDALRGERQRSAGDGRREAEGDRGGADHAGAEERDN